MSFYDDVFICPKCNYANKLKRRSATAGKLVQNRCRKCFKDVRVKANPLPVGAPVFKEIDEAKR